MTLQEHAQAIVDILAETQRTQDIEVIQALQKLDSVELDVRKFEDLK